MADDDKGKSIAEYAKMITIHKCSCGATLNTRYNNIKYYPHSGGWIVKGLFYSDRQWLYIHCDECGYDWALWKLGVPR